MGQVLQVNNDYRIKTLAGKDIILDTGENVGYVRITGNLLVSGETVTVEAEDLNLKDNIIVLNFGETGAGITLGTSGIQIDRGTEDVATVFFNEETQSWEFKVGPSFLDSRIKVKEIITDPLTDSGDLTLIGSGTGVVKVAGTVDYELQVTDDDDIPNKRYVDRKVLVDPPFQIRKSDTRVIAFDQQDPTDEEFFPLTPYFDQPAESQVGIIVDGVYSGRFFNDRAVIQGLRFSIEQGVGPLPDKAIVTAVETNGNIKLETSGTGKLETNYAIQLNSIPDIPAVVNQAVLLHSSSPAAGGTGVYFVNQQDNGELISKNKALLLSIIF